MPVKVLAIADFERYQGRLEALQLQVADLIKVGIEPDLQTDYLMSRLRICDVHLETALRTVMCSPIDVSAARLLLEDSQKELAFAAAALTELLAGVQGDLGCELEVFAMEANDLCLIG